MTDGALQSRRVALDVYAAAGRGGRPLDDALRDHAGYRRLPGRDRAFVRNLVSTAFRHRGQIEALLDAFVSRPLPPGEALVADIVHLGLAQLLFLDTPPHAAVDTSVRLAERSDRARMKGFVNAVLRRAGREGRALVERQDAARLNTPDWLWRGWAQAYGPELAHDIAAAHLRPAPLDLSAKSEPERWAEALGAAVLPTGSLRRSEGGLVSELPGFAEGAWWVQDAAAALPARLLGEVAGREIADLCCAPGGKTLQLAARGARVTAVDVSPARLKLVRDNLDRTGLAAETVAADVLNWRPGRPFDAVLLKARVAGSLQRKRWRDQEAVYLERLHRQIADVDAAELGVVRVCGRPGGGLRSSRVLPLGNALQRRVLDPSIVDGRAAFAVDSRPAPRARGAEAVDRDPIAADARGEKFG
mgnify:CR=1 FL=1